MAGEVQTVSYNNDMFSRNAGTLCIYVCIYIYCTYVCAVNIL